MALRVLVTGSRDWTDARVIENAMATAWHTAGRPEAVTLVHGGARGADAIAARIAQDRGWTVEEHRALWDENGRAAGVIRNALMVGLGADVCLAFIRDHSRGASDCAHRAATAGIPTARFTAD